MGSPPNAACAACKFQRRKCAAECPLAPWFPPDQPKRFANVHKLFGVANVLKLFRENHGKLEDLVKSIVYESDARERDPVNGAFGTLQLLQERQGELEGERERLKRIYDAMLAEEAKMARQAVYLPSNAPPLHSIGSMGNVVGAPSSSYINYSPGGSFWDLQMGMTSGQSSYGKQPQANFGQYGAGIGTTSPLLGPDPGYYYGGSMFSPAQQLRAPAAPQQQHQSQNIQSLQQHFQSASAVQPHPDTTVKGTPMMGSKSDAPQYMRDFLSLRNNQNFFP